MIKGTGEEPVRRNCKSLKSTGTNLIMVKNLWLHPSINDIYCSGWLFREVFKTSGFQVNREDITSRKREREREDVGLLLLLPLMLSSTEAWALVLSFRSKTRPTEAELTQQISVWFAPRQQAALLYFSHPPLNFQRKINYHIPKHGSAGWIQTGVLTQRERDVMTEKWKEKGVKTTAALKSDCM